MTVSSNYTPVQYVGNGVTTLFAVPFQFYDSTDLIVTSTVIATDVSTVLTLGVGYSVSGGSGSTGTITILTGAPASTVRITIERLVPYLQDADFDENTAFPATTLETALDKSVIMAQQTAERSNRALVIPSTDSGVTTTIPAKAVRAGKALFFDASGNPSVTDVVDTVSAAAAAASASAAAASASSASSAQAAAEAAAAGIKWKNSVKAATTGNITLSGPQTIDGISCVAGDRVLVRAQSTASQNGIYVVAAGSWTRATDVDTWDKLVSCAVSVEQGVTLADIQYICTSDSGGTLGVTSVTFSAIGSSISSIVSSFVAGSKGKILNGLTLSNNGTDATNDIDIAAGSVVSDDGTTIITLTAITKQLDAAWAVGTNQGMRDTGSISDNWWHIYAINRPDTGVSDVVSTITYGSPTLPTNYTKKAYIGSINRASAAIRQFTQNGKEFRWKSLVADVSTTASTGSRTLHTMTVPTGRKVDAIVNAVIASTSGSDMALLLTSPDDTDEAANATTGYATITSGAGAATNYYNGGQEVVRTDTSARIGSRGSSANNIRITTRGWVDPNL